MALRLPAQYVCFVSYAVPATRTAAGKCRERGECGGNSCCAHCFMLKALEGVLEQDSTVVRKGGPAIACISQCYSIAEIDAWHPR